MALELALEIRSTRKTKRSIQRKTLTVVQIFTTQQHIEQRNNFRT